MSFSELPTMRVVVEELGLCAAAFRKAGRDLRILVDTLAVGATCVGAAMPGTKAAPNYVGMWHRWRGALERLAEDLEIHSAAIDDAARTYLEADATGTRGPGKR